MLRYICLISALLCVFSNQSHALEATTQTSSKGVLQLCVVDNSPPYVFFDSTHKRHGFDMDVLEALELPYHLEFTSTDMATGLAMLDQNSCQMLLLSTLITPELEERYFISRSHLQSNIKALVLKESPLQNVEALSFSILGVLRGSSAEKFAFEELKDSTIIALKHKKTLFDLLLSGNVEALLGDELNLRPLEEHYKQIHLLKESLQVLHYGYVFSKENEALSAEVSARLEQIQQSMALTKLYDKWFAKRNIADIQEQ